MIEEVYREFSFAWRIVFAGHGQFEIMPYGAEEDTVCGIGGMPLRIV